MEKDSPQFLSALRTCDIPDTLGLIAPRPLTVRTKNRWGFARTAAAYTAAGVAESCQLVE